jgi:hypothetical protein
MDDIKEFPRKFENRAKKFALRIIPLSTAFPIHRTAWLSEIRPSFLRYFNFRHFSSL